MCGICGIVELGRPAQLETVRAMAAELAHRGPDGDGFFDAPGVAFGHRRLAILDLSDAGLQPFASRDGRYQLLHNGEIYNYRELRTELETLGHGFETETDTEVLLAAFVQWGEVCLDRLVGMWAFALWDTTEQRLFAARDRFGIKPFYYRFDGRRLVFASEPKAFRVDPETRLAANPAAVADYLAQSYIDHGSETFFAGIHRLPPAHTLTLDHNGLRLRRYWRLQAAETPSGEAPERVREAFLDAVRLHLRSDVPIGTCLSGGIDSSAIAVAIDLLLRTEHANALAVGERQQTFTAYFDDKGFDERPFATAVVERTGALPHWVSFDAETLVDDLPRIVETQDEPFGSTSMAAQWYVLRRAKEAGMKVMLDGQGGDEVFGGYRAFIGFRLADALAGGRVDVVARELRAFGDVHRSPALLVSLLRPFAPEALTRAVRARSRGAAPLVHPDLRRLPSPEAAEPSLLRTRLARHQETILTRRGLPELLRYEDRNSMAHSIEARVPFLDHRLVELAFSLRGEELIADGTTKRVVRRALADLLPPAVRDRRDKLGFVTPEARFMRGALGDLALDAFESQAARQRGFLDVDAVRRRLERHRRGELDAGMELWRALNVELWARTFLDAPVGAAAA